MAHHLRTHGSGKNAPERELLRRTPRINACNKTDGDAAQATFGVLMFSILAAAELQSRGSTRRSPYPTPHTRALCSASVPERVNGTGNRTLCVCLCVMCIYIYRALPPLSVPCRSDGNFGEPDARALAPQRHTTVTRFNLPVARLTGFPAVMAEPQ